MRFLPSGVIYGVALWGVFLVTSAFAGISCPESVSENHCDLLFFSVSVDSTTDISDLTFSVTADGPNDVSIDSMGRVRYFPEPFVPDEPFTITVSAVSGSGEVFSCSTSARFTNVAPTITCLRDAEVVRGRENTVKVVQGSSGDCDAIHYSLVSVSPEPLGVVTVDPISGAVTFAADESDAPGYDVDYLITIVVSDGHESDTCFFVFTALHEEAFKFVIQQVNDIFQGGREKVAILSAGGTMPIGGFDFRLSYDSTALELVSVTKGNIFSDYGWEFFKTDFDPTDTGNFEPGELRIVGLSDLSGIPGSPADVVFKLGDTIAVMEFLLANDRTLGCRFLPLRWIWRKCTDNMVSSMIQRKLYQSRSVFDYVGTDPFNTETDWRMDITNKCDTSPMFGGAGCVCDSSSGSSFRPFIDFKNGGLKTICCGCIDSRGDLNANGINSEIADAELFVDYFLNGLSTFDSIFPIEGAIESSDVNRDGIPLTLEDLAYLIRIITGDALPTNALTHDADTVRIRHSGNFLSTDTELGAILIEMKGDVEAILLQKNMSIGIGELHGNTRIIVYDIGLGKLDPGGIVVAKGEIVSVKAVDYNGSRMIVEFDFATDVSADENAALPHEFRLHQNYPNPFNPTTTIEFSIPSRGALELIVYNTLGRKVRTLASGMYGAGKYTVSWDGTDDHGKQVTSGVYYYRLKSGGVVQSKKMVLLK